MEGQAQMTGVQHHEWKRIMGLPKTFKLLSLVPLDDGRGLSEPRVLEDRLASGVELTTEPTAVGGIGQNTFCAEQIVRRQRG